MKIKYLLFLGCLFWMLKIEKSFSQINGPIIITSDTAEYSLSLSNLQYYQETDSTDRLKLKVLNSVLYRLQFKYLDTTKIEIQNKHLIWIKFDIKNILPKKVSECLIIYGDIIRLRAINIFNVIDTLKPLTGYDIDIEGVKETRGYILPLQLDTFETKSIFILEDELNSIYKFVHNVKIGSLNRQLMVVSKRNEFHLTNSSFYRSFLGGIIFLGGLLLLSFFYVNRTKSYFYGFLILLMISISTILDNYDHELLYGNLKGLIIISKIISTLLNVFFIYFFIRNWFGLYVTMPKYDRFLKIFTILLFPGIVILFFVIVIAYSLLNSNEKSEEALYFAIYLLILIWVIYVFCLLSIPYLLRTVKKREAAFISLAFLPTILVYYLGAVVEYALTRNSYYQDKYDWVINLLFIWTTILLIYELLRKYKNQEHALILQTSENQKLQLEKEREINDLVSKQNEKLEALVSHRTTELQSSMISLKDTQEKLIHSEKMASLGTLTAGIAHEIQNPLNFINNFSELNGELVVELHNEVSQGKVDNAVEVSRTIKENSEKIHFHGKRADSIVKNMLQHSRSSSRAGTHVMSLTDINALLDECWRLVYHGFRANASKDDNLKDFNIMIDFDLDMAMQPINVNPEEISRVFINLLNNALYALKAKKLLSGQETPFIPSLKIATCEKGGSCLIRIEDNGIGIPDNIKDKIFNPFFTTKPTGQGVGLGLSLSYEIIVHGHGGTITVVSEENKGT
ncbi:MAG: ATP-binding protein, partial [Saprospiraceae bacterium]